MAFPCGEMYVPTVVTQQDFTGTPLTLLGAKASVAKLLPPIQTHGAKLENVQILKYVYMFIAHTYMQTHTQKLGSKWVQSGPRGSLPATHGPC